VRAIGRRAHRALARRDDRIDELLTASRAGCARGSQLCRPVLDPCSRRTHALRRRIVCDRRWNSCVADVGLELAASGTIESAHTGFDWHGRVH
jgi:hypothetical protein